MSNLLKIFHPYQVDGLIRLGNQFDGGYILHAPSLQGVDLLVTYGVGYNIEFEKDFNRLTGAPVLAFDPTMKDSNIFIEKIKKGDFIQAIKQLRWLLIWLSNQKDLKKHHITFVEEGIAVNDTKNYKSFHTHVGEYELQNKNIVLKIDIDGGEYEIFSDGDFYTQIESASQLLIEFHDLDLNLNKAHDILNKLSLTHSLIHIHGNNYGPPFIYNGKKIPKVIEVSLLRNDLLTVKQLSTLNYPIAGLDAPCDKSNEDIKMDFFN